MQLPKKISPDSILDATVEIRYTSSTPFILIVGLVFGSLDDSYSFTTQQPNINGIPSELIQSNSNIFYTDKIKFELRPNSISFHCVNKYLGWSVYFEEISRTLRQIAKIKEIDNFSRIGIRYISQYPSKKLKDISNFTFTFGMNTIESELFAFRSEFILDIYRVILNIQNSAPTNSFNSKNNSTDSIFSLIDVDVILDRINITSMDELLKEIDNAHKTEKEVFFNILKQEFLLTLNPIY